MYGRESGRVWKASGCVRELSIECVLVELRSVEC